jgi:hypothetical protein
MPQIHLDDFIPGQVHHLGERTLSRDEIVAFARDWDPQPFHLDEQAAAASIYGGLIASGWHTVCAFMRLFADGLLNRAAAMGSSRCAPVTDLTRASRCSRSGRRAPSPIAVLSGCAASWPTSTRRRVLSFIGNVMFRRRPAAAQD